MMESLRPIFVVGVGGSAGGLYAYMAFLDAMSPSTGMAFVIVSHMLPTANNLLAELLVSHTKMPVLVATATMPIRPNHVYVTPPNSDLGIENNAFTVTSPRSRSRKQIDIFLISLAENIGKRAIGVIFSGYDGDGTEGCKHIKAKGGKTFAQDMSADVGEMPFSAQASGSIDFVLPPDKISAQLQRMAGALFRAEQKHAVS